MGTDPQPQSNPAPQSPPTPALQIPCPCPISHPLTPHAVHVGGFGVGMAPCFSMETRWAPILRPSIPTPKDSHPQKCHCHPKPPTHHLHALSWKCHHYLLAPAPFMCVSHLYPMSPGWHLCPLAGEVAFPPPAMEVAPPSPPHGCCSPCPHHACVTSLSGGMSPGVRALEDWA